MIPVLSTPLPKTPSGEGRPARALLVRMCRQSVSGPREEGDQFLRDRAAVDK